MSNGFTWKQERISVFAVFCLLASLVFGSLGLAVPASAAGTTYYVSASGSDSNSGTSASSPWKTLTKVNAVSFAAGDRVLFKSGDTWSGQLLITHSGTAADPITFSSYGTGGKPLLNGGGIGATVSISGASYITVDGLAVTNYDGADVYDGAEGDRDGIKIAGAVTGIDITGNEVYEIEGCSDNASVGAPRGSTLDPATCNLYTNGAIFQTGSGASDVTIENNYVHDTTNTAILTTNVNSGLLIANNTVINGGADGIEYWNVDAPLIQSNSVTGVGNNSGSSPRGSGVIGMNGAAVAGIWGFNATDQVVQYNYVEGTHRIHYDGQAWDFDSGTVGGVYQYNFSRDNEGGFVLGGDTDQTLRYNISYNDGAGQLSYQGFFNANSNYYNNVFYQNNGAGFNKSQLTGGVFKNNIFYTNSTNTSYTDYQSGGATFSNNCFGGSQSAQNTGTNAVVADPLFVDPSSVGHAQNAVDGLKLAAGSPCIDAGISIAGNGGQDYWGNPLYNGTPDIGAYEMPSGGSGSSAELFADDFASDAAGSAPSGWTVTTAGGPITVASTADGSGGSTQALHVVQTSGNGNSSSAAASFAATGGAVTVDLRMKAGQTGSYGYGPILSDSSGTNAVFLGFKDNGQLGELDSIGAWRDLGTYAANQWYDLHIVADTDTDTFDLSVDGTPVLTGEPFKSAVADLSSLSFAPYRWNAGSFDYDDIAVRAGTGNTHGGSWALRQLNAGTASGTGPYQTVSGIAANSTYAFSAWVKGSGQQGKLVVYDTSWNVIAESTPYTSNGVWTQTSTPSFNTGSHTSLIVQFIDLGSTAGATYWDDAFLGVSAGTNKLNNAGFESGSTGWTIGGPYTILQP